ncbi:hypothetical protein AC1031_018108 [Aphanomyces cochlioides]|nr:hypothetical protein AC1031_018108 [Aphanomyces cochlioides]
MLCVILSETHEEKTFGNDVRWFDFRTSHSFQGIPSTTQWATAFPHPLGESVYFYQSPRLTSVSPVSLLSTIKSGTCVVMTKIQAHQTPTHSSVVVWNRFSIVYSLAFCLNLMAAPLKAYISKTNCGVLQRWLSTICV